ncbi:MAG: hypothetical protein WC360_01695 [Opitutales bacterium]|jgi:hypothetical protein
MTDDDAPFARELEVVFYRRFSPPLRTGDAGAKKPHVPEQGRAAWKSLILAAAARGRRSIYSDCHKSANLMPQDERVPLADGSESRPYP